MGFTPFLNLNQTLFWTFRFIRTPHFVVFFNKFQWDTTSCGVLFKFRKKNPQTLKLPAKNGVYTIFFKGAVKKGEWKEKNVLEDL